MWARPWMGLRSAERKYTPRRGRAEKSENGAELWCLRSCKSGPRDHVKQGLTRIHLLRTDSRRARARRSHAFQSPDEDSLTPKDLVQTLEGHEGKKFQSPDEDSLTPKSQSRHISRFFTPGPLYVGWRAALWGTSWASTTHPILLRSLDDDPKKRATCRMVGRHRCLPL